MSFRKRRATRVFGFTIIEVMIAVFIFAMVLSAIYATWIAILRGSKAGLAAAAEVQRSRIAARSVEQALSTAQLFYENVRYYTFIGESTGDFAYLSMVSHLPASFPGVGRYGGGDFAVRRVTFAVQSSPDGKNELVMTQAPMLMATNQSGVEPYTLILAKDVTQFTCDFFDPQKKDWVDTWSATNQLPRLVRVTLGLGKSQNSSRPHDLVSRLVAIPSIAVMGAQGAGGGNPGGGGANPRNPRNPGGRGGTGGSPPVLPPGSTVPQ